MKKILNFGSINVDEVFSVSHFVSAGETLAAKKSEKFPGGKGLNQSIALSRAGAKVFHAGKISPDEDWLYELLLESGVDLSFLSRNGSRAGKAIIQLNPLGENSIIVDHGSNFEITKEQIDETLSDFQKGDLLLVQNEISNLPYIVSKASKIGMEIALNPSPIDEVIFSLDLNTISYLILNEIEGEALTKEKDPQKICNLLLERYPNLKIVLTLGGDGAIYKDKDFSCFQSSFDVKPVDTTGAGDTFTGYFLAQISMGQDVKSSLKLASKAAGIAVTKKGAASSIPKIEDVLSLDIKEK